MKKVFILVLLSVLILSGCGRASDKSPPKSSAGTQSVTVNTAADDKSVSDNKNEAIKADNTEESVSSDSDDIIEIKEKMFVAQTKDIYLNANEYLGKTIKYEGYLSKYYSEAIDKTFYFVVRNGPGCCGNDELVGFEVVWDDEFPEVNDWVEVKGVLESFEEGDYSYLRIAVESMTVLDVRGQETVYQ